MNKSMITVAKLKFEEGAAVVIVNHKGFVTYVNHAFENYFGWSAEEMLGAPVTRIIPESYRDAHQLGFSRFITTGRARILNMALKLPTLNRSGEVFETEHFMVAERIDGDWQIGAILRRLDED